MEENNNEELKKENVLEEVNEIEENGIKIADDADLLKDSKDNAELKKGYASIIEDFNNKNAEREKEKELLNSLQIEYNCLVLNKPLDEDYTNIINDYLEFKTPTRQLLASLIDKIEIDENKNVDIHLKVKSIY